MSDDLARNREQVELANACWFLTGATAVGKTAVSVELARRLNAEIISLDSMSIYRGMDLGTAKPSAATRAMVPHHLIDICDPIDRFSVSQYRDLALATIHEIRARGKQVLFVGGSALYLKAMLRGLFQGPPADLTFRQEIENALEQMPPGELHRRLQIVDPLSAHKLHPNDQRRIIRALEVLHATGKPISHWQMEFDRAKQAEECRVFCLRRPRPELHARIAERIDRMFADGFVDEVQSLMNQWEGFGRTASQAVGYHEVCQYLTGESPLESTKELVLVRTRRFARHQETWFRGLSECQIIDIRTPSDDPLQIAKTLEEIGMSRQS